LFDNNNNEDNSARNNTTGYLIYNVQTEKLTVLSDKIKWYAFLGFYNNQILTETHNEDTNKGEICLVDYKGVVTKTIYTFGDKVYFNDDMWLLDKENHRLFYSYVSEKSKEFTYHIFEIDLQTNVVKTLFTKKLPKETTKKPDEYISYLSIHYCKERDCLQFIINKKQNPTEETTFYEINLSTDEIDSFLLPNNENFYYSKDGQYILCFGYFSLINSSPPTETKILNVANKQLINLKSDLDLNYSGTDEFFFSESTNQFVLCCEIVSEPKDYWITFIGIDGSVEQLELLEPKYKK
jgi:hypothetical protein